MNGTMLIERPPVAVRPTAGRDAQANGPSPDTPGTETRSERAEDPRAKEQAVVGKLRAGLRKVLGTRLAFPKKDDAIAKLLQTALEATGAFYRTATGAVLFFRRSDRRLYELDGRPSGRFGQLVTYYTDLSLQLKVLARACDRLRARATETAQTVQVHGLAYNSPTLDEIAINDYGGGYWYRRRGGAWEWRPNGHNGIFFWTPDPLVEPWRPDFSGDAAQDAAHFDGLLAQPHFAEDVLTIADQRLLLRAVLLAPFFPARNRTCPVLAFLGLSDRRQHDTGKTTAGKLLGHLFVGPRFLPTPVKRTTEKGEEDVQLCLMRLPFVLLDNLDVDIPWLNDFLCVYATGNRATKRKLYEDTTLVHIEGRGWLCLTSRKPRFTRVDTASRVIPFRFRPIEPEERRPEWEVLDPVIQGRGRLWAGLLAAVARVQDALPHLAPPQPTIRLADFEQFGWCVAAVSGQTQPWERAIRRLTAAQAGFALDDEPLVPILRRLLEAGDLAEEPTAAFYTRVQQTAHSLGIPAPADAAACTRRIHELEGQLGPILDARIHTRTLHGQTHIAIGRGPSWGQAGDRGDPARFPPPGASQEDNEKEGHWPTSPTPEDGAAHSPLASTDGTKTDEATATEAVRSSTSPLVGRAAHNEQEQ